MRRWRRWVWDCRFRNKCEDQESQKDSKNCTHHCRAHPRHPIRHPTRCCVVAAIVHESSLLFHSQIFGKTTNCEWTSLLP
jgi:hypothetical protein